MAFAQLAGITFPWLSLMGHVTESNGASWEASVRSQVTGPSSRGNDVQLWPFIGHCMKEAKRTCSFFGVTSKHVHMYNANGTKCHAID